jgi:predicted Ser/Thr protein kinase
MTTCQVCGVQNSDADVCQRCGGTLNASPTMSISSEIEVAAPRATPLSHSSSSVLGFAPGAMVADRYRVIALLGRGGMGEVYGADDLKLGQRVALKFIPADRLKSSSWRDQFYAEVRMARQVSHPNVCRVYDVGESDGRIFLSMEFVDGEDLASLLRRIGRLPDDKAVEVAQQLCAGLAAAHASGVLHRDLKPSNVMLDGKGRARITDFGLAIAETDADREKIPAGTPGYLAPELFSGARPSVQSDLYALGLILYELFTGKKAFEASSVAELHRKQSETNPTPPSSVVKNLDPAVERAILRCLDRDPAQRPRSAHAVSAALPGGDPLAAALAAGETPSPDMIAAAGPQGSLRPSVAWACLIASLVLLLVMETVTYPRASDWGRASMPKSPEVLTDRAQEFARKLGYPEAVDHASWIQQQAGFLRYVAHDASGKQWERASAGKAWPSPMAFWFRQSPRWMMPVTSANGIPGVSTNNPPYEIAGMVTLKLDMVGRLLFLRAVPSQLEVTPSTHEPDWSQLFAEAGLNESEFVPVAPKWLPQDSFDASAGWDGYFGGDHNLPLHVVAASWRGRPVYFQVIAPWDKPWQEIDAAESPISSKIGALCAVLLLLGYIVGGSFFARRNFLRGRADVQGALRLFTVLMCCFCLSFLLESHFAPYPFYVWSQFLFLSVPMLVSFLAWVGYMAVEPYVRRTWPHVMVSWQRLLNGRFRDPLIGRDLLLGTVTAFAFSLFQSFVAPLEVSYSFGKGALSSISFVMASLFSSCFVAILFLTILSGLTGLLRRKWLGLLVAGLILATLGLLGGGWGDVGIATNVAMTILLLFVLTRIGLLAAVSFVLGTSITGAPPLVFSQWYAGRAVIALLLPLAFLMYGFYISLGNQPIFGSALKDG